VSIFLAMRRSNIDLGYVVPFFLLLITIIVCALVMSVFLLFLDVSCCRLCIMKHFIIKIISLY
jgi:hypothetical protein